jgi:hypothetical protein
MGIVAVALVLMGQEAVDFARDIEPIFKAACVECHGAKKPKAQFRVDSKPHAMQGGVGGPAIVPGKGAESFLVKLLLSEDPEERMPRKAPPLPEAKIGLIRRWIDQGAAWPDVAGAGAVTRHWAYVKPVRPKVSGPLPIDALVRARLDVPPAPEASKETLIRRVSLDLIGLPPSPAEIDAFLADDAPGAYERLVDRLLASPHYGERWARSWLDLARYADTNGFNFDTRRTMWKYRDWVIDALNRDMPYDRFTIEQIAGDLLPDATFPQKIATGFHRNTMTNEEGGTDPAEARWETLVDRVSTTGAVWLGTTLACSQCHNHKYDPFPQRDFYRLLAYWETTDEPKIELLTEEQKAERKRLREALVAEEKELRKAELPSHIVKAIDTPIEKRTNTNRNDIVIYCRAQAPPELKPIASKMLELNEALDRIDGATALVMQEKKGAGVPTTPIRIKGGFANVGEKVDAGVPASLHPMPPGAPQNRLGLALWLASPENPLAARVAVNRFWGEFFGRPIVESPEDFGTQAQPPSHPELLDWLAVEFMERGWSMKAIQKTIVLSATYRQSSRMTPAQYERDPLNRLLARGPRFRMDAETIRDAVLTASGQLSRKIGGPSVFPLQADMSGVVAINKVDTSWKPSEGEERYRRGLYTHWRRTAPYAAFMTFDAPSRETCTVQRQRTNTPLQALSALNDPAFWDAAKGLAGRMQAEGGADPASRSAYGFRLCTGRHPDAFERDRLVKLYESERAAGEAAAWTRVANVLLNLDETLTKE